MKPSPRPLLITLSFFVLLLFFAASTAFSANRRKGPYLIYPGDPASMEVHWQLDGRDTCLLEWGTDAACSLGRTTTREYGTDHQHAFTITGLDGGKKYDYRVTMGGVCYGGSFCAGPPAEATKLKFMVYGDTRSHPSKHDNVAAAMISTFTRDPEYQTLVVSTGDLVSRGRREADWEDRFFDASYPHIQEMLARLPYHSVAGNHELGGFGKHDPFEKYFPYPFVAGHYWSFDYGPAHFVVMDQYVSYAPGSPQLTWIEKDLAATGKRWKFIVLHEPGWSAGGGHGNNTSVQKHIQPLCKEYNVRIVFGGHNHYYARAVVDGITHITTGGGGAPLYSPHPDYPHVVAVSKSHHFCKIEIDGDTLHFSAVKPKGKVIDTFSLVLPLRAGTKKAKKGSLPGTRQARSV